MTKIGAVGSSSAAVFSASANHVLTASVVPYVDCRAVLPQRDDRDAANLDNLVGFLPGILFESIAGRLAAAFVVADAPDRLTLGVVRMILRGLEQRRILRFSSAVGNVADKYLRGICPQCPLCQCC